MLKDFCKSIIVSIIVTAFMTVVLVILSRFFMADISFYYSVLEGKWPSKVNFERVQSLPEPMQDTQVLRIFLKNKSKNILRISEINIGGADLFLGSKTSMLVAA